MSSTSTNDLISTWRLRARIYHDSTHHEFIETGNWKSLFRRKREERWVRKKYLGRGTFGQVWLETCSIGGGGQAKFRAVKIVSKVALSADGMDYTRELEAMIRLSQSKYDAFFVKFLGWFEDPSSVYITMEYLENGDLEKHLSKQALPEVETRQIVFQVLKGLELLHESGFAHRDLKPENIFVVQGAPDWYVKIGDFGISKRVVDENTQYRTMGVGTPGYWAPEVLGEVISMHKDRAGNMQYTRLVDMWSLGVITFYILTGSLPFEKLAELVAFVHGGPFPDSKLVYARLSESSKDFIRSLIVVEPAKRLNASLALGHSWWDSMHLTHKPGLFENSSVRGPEDASKSPIADLAAPQLDSTPTTADSISSLHSSFVQIEKLTDLFDGHKFPGTISDSWVSRVKGLLEGGAYVDSTFQCGCTTLHLAAQDNHVEIMIVLLRYHANPRVQNDHGWTPLHAAANAGQFEAARLLLMHGAADTANLGNKDGWTPLHEAAYKGHHRICELLLSHGAEIDKDDRLGRSALFVAAGGGRLSTVNQLLLSNASITKVGERRRSVLQEAVKGRNPKVVRLLLEHGADVTAKNEDGWTPLHEAAFQGALEICRSLVNADASILTKDAVNRTPLYLARSRNHLRVIEYLEALEGHEHDL